MFIDTGTSAKIKARVACSRIASDAACSFLVMSGSFNPIHVEHIHALDIAKNHAETEGFSVLAGFLAPSTDEYVAAKYGDRALSFRERRLLCELAVRDVPWMCVSSVPELSSNFVCKELGRELGTLLPSIGPSTLLRGVEVMGSDTVLRIFSGAIAGYISNYTKTDRIIYWLPRKLEGKADRNDVEGLIARLSGKLNVKFVAIDAPPEDRPFAELSSTAIGELVTQGEWGALRAKQWLHPAVLDALEVLRLGDLK
jgi:hypothetical protein